ncbi:hypothetical protein Zmor_018517 [Zophobas morio]|uniref:Gustatory receptor n=1 Tax=Zophobas morio TaxID=2755281 RepID=A0AA38ICI3_9CUCU|nr:hypothetical protein Zmor_018517 [Zophobas morio]
MNFRLLRLIMLFGEIFAITPRRNKVKKIRTKIYSICVITALMVASTISVLYYRQPLYVNFSPIKLVLTISMVLIVNIFNCYTVLAPVYFKRRQYCFLIRMLEQNDNVTLDDLCEKIPFYAGFVAPNVIYWGITVYVSYVWTDILGFEYYEQYFVEVIQLYFQFYYSYFLCMFVKVFVGKYKYVNFLLSEQILYMQMRRPTTLERFPISMRRIENLVCFLKEMNVAFNDVFGWPIILIILYSSILLLNYLDDIFKNSFGYSKNQYVGVIISNISVVFLANIGTIALILLCDLVLDEAKTTTLLAYKLRQYALLVEKQEISDFITLMSDNFPQFTAAGFFSVNKTTILNIMGTVTTFFIIIIQFNTSRVLYCDKYGV